MKKIEKTLSILLVGSLMMSPVKALTKNETVYSKLNADGSVKKIIVSEYLKNNEEKIEDKTNLKNILNLNGNEKYKFEGSNIIWDAKGKDIYYQGETDEKLPVSVNVTYKLNGQDIKLDDLLGKKGKVEINLKYVNSDKHTLNVNGQMTDLYTPFLVTVGTIVKNDNNSNIEVTNGKVVSNGKNSIIVAMASPGLYESLDMDRFKNLDTVKITYDTKKFELNSIYSVVSSKLIEEDDVKIFDELDGVYSKVNKLADSSKKIVNGSNSLKDGTTRLKEGANKAYNGTQLLNNELITKIKASENTPVLSEEQINTIKTNSLAGVNESLKNSEATIKGGAKAGFETALDEYYIKQLQAALDQLNCADPNRAVPCNQTELAKYTNIMQVKTILTNDEVKANLSNIAAGVSYETAKNTALGVVGGNGEQAGVAVSVATTVATNAKEETLKSLKTLSGAISELNNGLKDLSNGTNDLENGAATLAQGISDFDNQGISKINNLVNGDIKTKEERIRKLIKLGSAYDTFTLKGENTKGETKFVLIIESAKKSNKTK